MRHDLRDRLYVALAVLGLLGLVAPFMWAALATGAP